jgi:formate-dependent nitrite reductase membrane component NrfD
VSDYYGLPTLKRPVWTWEVPAYFFVGGAAGAAATIAAAARIAGGRPDLVRDARWIAAAGGLISPPLLIADLGRPERFLNMLRVFKVQSPMSVGAWTLVAFSNAAAASACADWIDRASGGRVPVRVLGNAAEAVAAATGLVLSTYTGVLIGATAIPSWAENVRILPVHFGASAIGSAVSILELMGHRDPALNMLGAGAAAIETLIGASLELSLASRGSADAATREALVPLTHGWSGRVVRAGGVLSGPLPLALRVLAARSPSARKAAAVSTIVGSVLTRVGWLAAGRESAARS